MRRHGAMRDAEKSQRSANFAKQQQEKRCPKGAAAAQGSTRRRSWCPAGASKSRQPAASVSGAPAVVEDLSSEDFYAEYINKNCSTKSKKPTNLEPPPRKSPGSLKVVEDPSLEEVPDQTVPLSPPPPPPPPPKKNQSNKDALNFSYLKDGLTAGSLRDPEDGGARRAVLDSIEDALTGAQARADRLVELAMKAADPAGEPLDDCGRCATMEEARQLKHCIAGLGDILSRMRQRQPVTLARPEPGGSYLQLAGCPHSGRNRLAELRSRYERSLLLTPADISWPFVHLIAPAWPVPPSATEDCRSANC